MIEDFHFHGLQKSALAMTRLAYLDCSAGISGDMMLAALIDAGADLDRLNAAISSLGLPECRLTIEEVHRRGFRALKVNVHFAAEHAHRHLHEIAAMIDASRISPRAKERANRIFLRLAEAEAKVHGTCIEKIHFHEVGAADSIADIVGTVVGLELLGIERVAASPLPTGSGKIEIAHGQCSVPAPATAELLKGVPLTASNIEGELTTPTGAAILATLAESFGPPPSMTIHAIGYGAGSHDWPGQPNILRLMLAKKGSELFSASETVCQLETTLDDLSGEIVGYCIESLWQAGALEVYTIAVGMKKNRPGVLLTVLCEPADAARMEEIIFRETTTLGIRQTMTVRRVLKREPRSVETPWGTIAGKIGWLPDGQPRFSPEYESCRQAAEKHARSLREVYEAAQKAFTRN
jgi:pyridinium-3,5-bisthiocarboxylic acid mononucleotide nickel chelatase